MCVYVFFSHFFLNWIVYGGIFTFSISSYLSHSLSVVPFIIIFFVFFLLFFIHISVNLFSYQINKNKIEKTLKNKTNEMREMELLGNISLHIEILYVDCVLLSFLFLLFVISMEKNQRKNV